MLGFSYSPPQVMTYRSSMRVRQIQQIKKMSVIMILLLTLFFSGLSAAKVFADDYWDKAAEQAQEAGVDPDKYGKTQAELIAGDTSEDWVDYSYEQMKAELGSSTTPNLGITSGASVAINCFHLTQLSSSGIVDVIDDTLTHTYDTLIKNNDADSAGFALAKNISDAVKVTGALLVFLTVMAEIARSISRGDITMEALTRVALFTIVGMILVSNTDAILNMIDLVGAEMRTAVHGAITSNNSDDNAAKLYEAIKAAYPPTKVEMQWGDFSWVRAMAANTGINIWLLVLRLMAKFAVWICSIQVFSAIFEMVLRRAFAPIAVGSTLRTGLQGPGMAFFKGYFAMYVRLAMMEVVACTNTILKGAMFYRFTQWSLGGPIYYIVTLIMLDFTTYALLKRTGTMSNNIMNGR